MFIRSFCLADMCLNVVVNNLELIVSNEKIPQKSVDFVHTELNEPQWQNYSDNVAETPKYFAERFLVYKLCRRKHKNFLPHTYYMWLVFRVRVYPGKIFYEYRKLTKSIKEDVMLWFLNPHVKEVTLPKKLFSEKIINKLQSIGMGITSLNLHRSAAPEDVLNTIIRCVPNVKLLDLSHTCCTDNSLSVIQEACPYLESLNLSCCENITDDGLENLCDKNQSLKNLDLTYSGVECYGAAIVLNRMPLLECVKFDSFIDILIEDRIYNNKTYNLTELMYETVSEDDSKAITTLTKICPKIKKLHFESPVGKKALRACTGFQELEELKFKVPHRSYEHVRRDNFLAPVLPISLNLKTLILSCLRIPTVMLIENFKNLERLYLKKVSFTPFNMEDIKCTENKLHTLVIKSTDMKVSSSTYQAVNLLISLSKNVVKLDLSHNRELPSDLFDVILNSMKDLFSVNLHFTHVKMDLLIPFFDIPSLKMIIVNCYDDKENFSKQKLLPKFSSTLSWCHMFNEDSDDDSPMDHDSCDDDDDDSTDDDSINDDVISNTCHSDRSTPDIYYYFPPIPYDYNPYGDPYFQGDQDYDEFDL